MSAWVAAALAIAVIIGLGFYYCYTQYKNDDIDIDIQRAGDDLYYLGLLFTLASLTYSLIRLFILDGEGSDSGRTYESRTNELIGSFGIALLSTIVGILARIMLQSLEEDDERKKAQGADPGYLDSGLSEGARRLRAEMRDASDAFSHYSRMTMLQAEHTREHAKRISEEFSRELEGTAKKSIARLRDIYQGLSDQAQATNDTLQRSAESVANALTEFTRRLEAVNQAFTTAAGSIGRVQGNMDALMQNLEEAGQNILRLATEFKEATRGVSALSESANTISSTFGDKMNSFLGDMESLSQAAKGHKEATEKSLEEAKAMRADASSEVSEWIQQIKRMNNDLGDLSATLPALVKQLKRAGRMPDQARASRSWFEFWKK